jgi:protein gp37
MIDLFYDSMPSEWISLIIAQIMKYPQHCFLFLTKFPKRYTSFKFPSNCLLGATITCQRDLWRIDLIREIGGFLSCEPLLEDLSDLDFHGIEWIIIGGLTPRPVHNKEWVDKIVEQADFCKIPVFIKDNALYLPVKREFPENEVKPCWCLHYQDVIDNKQAIK